MLIPLPRRVKLSDLATSCGCSLFVPPALVLLVGLWTLYVALRNPHPIPVTLAEYRSRRPSDGWYRVSGVKLDPKRMFWVTTRYRTHNDEGGRKGTLDVHISQKAEDLSSIYLPVEDAARAQPDHAVTTVVCTNDAKLLEALKATPPGTMKAAAGEMSDGSTSLLRILKGKFSPKDLQRDVDGMAEVGLSSSLDPGEAAQLARDLGTSPDKLLVINETNRPSMTSALYTLGCGGALLLLAIPFCYLFIRLGRSLRPGEQQRQPWVAPPPKQ